MKIFAKRWWAGYSWGLDWPKLFIDMTIPGAALHHWAVIERGTGLVLECFEGRPNVHGWSDAKDRASRASCPPYDHAEAMRVNADHDAEA